MSILHMEVFNGHNKLGVVSWPRQFVAGLSLHKPGCCTIPVFVGFKMDKVALEGLFLSNFCLYRQHHSTSARYSFTHLSWML
jgi:hypothetical protein